MRCRRWREPSLIIVFFPRNMASKAWFKPSALPQLIAKLDPPPSSSNPPPACTTRMRKRAIEVWTTTCIVTNSGMISQRYDDADDDTPTHHDDERCDGSSSLSSLLLPLCSILINPLNPNLTGPHSFPYFPRGGPVPSLRPNKHAHHIMGDVSRWGGMDVGGGEFLQI